MALGPQNGSGPPKESRTIKWLQGPKREPGPKMGPGPKMALGSQPALGPQMAPGGCGWGGFGGVLGSHLSLPLAPPSRLFQLDDEAEALQRFQHYAGHLRPFYESSPQPLGLEELQQLCDCLRSHPGWSPAHVAVEIGLLEAFRHNRVLG